MKTSFNRNLYHHLNWYRCVLFSTLTVMTGVCSVNINSQARPVPGAASRPVEINEKPEKPDSRNITDNDISNPGLRDEGYIKAGNNSVIMLPEFRQKSISIFQGSTASTLSGSALTGHEIEIMKTDINPPHEKAAITLPEALNVSKIPDRDNHRVFKAEGSEVTVDDRQIDALSDFRGSEPVKMQDEIKRYETEESGYKNPMMDETENMINITPDSENIYLKSGLAGENLTTYQPSGWDNRIVISSVTGTHTSTAPFFNNQTLYVDWAVTNNGTTAITATFYTRLYIDGTLKNTWYTSGLDVGKWVYISDYNIGILTSGTHQIKIQTDVTGVVAETNESDNEYTRTITVYPYVNLTTYQPAGWDSRIVLSTVSGTNTSDPQIFDTDNIYLDWSIVNNSSNSTTTTFYIDLYIDGTWKAAWTRAGLGANTFTTQLDYLVGKLSAGSHTFQIRIDMDGYVPEYNETDNEYSRTITVVNKNLLPYQPSGWDNKLVISTVTGTHSSSSAFYNNQDLYVDFAVVNNGSAAITETFHSKIYVDGVVTNTYYTSGLNSNYWVYVQDINIGKLAIGNHTVRIVTDSDAEVAETNEADNSYSRTFYVGPSYNLIPYQPSGWDNRLVLSTETGTTTSSSVFYDTQNIYADWACLNNGFNDFTTTFYIRLYVDGTAVAAWTKAGLNHNTYTWGVDGNLGKLTAGTHTIKVVVDSDGDVAESDESDNEYTRTITVINKNLLPYQPAGWDNRIVLSTVTGTSTSASSICENQVLYLDYSIRNNGSASITETFYVRLYIDGTTKATWTRSGIGANTYYTIQDFAIGTLAAGSHTARIVADVLDNVDETSESDNEYTLTFNVSTCKNLTPYQPSTWDNKLVLSTVTGTNTSATTFYNDQDILVDWAIINNGTVNITEIFNIKLYVDGAERGSWTRSGLVTGVYVYFLDFNAGKLTAGNHTFKIVADADNNVVETNESDNEYSRTITVVPAPYLNVSSATLSVAYPEGSTGTFNISSNVSWTAAASATWLTLNRASGSGDATITVTAQKNPATSSRTATITVSGTGVSNKTVTVTQEAAPASLEVSPVTLTVGYPEGSTGTFNITSNISWTASSSSTWLTLNRASGSGDAAITVTAQRNPSAATRTATITLSGTGVANKTVTVTQEAAPGYLDVSPVTLTVGYPEGSTGTFNITSNIGWTASSSSTWLTLNRASGSGDAAITVTAQRNPSAATRTATITLSGTGVANKTVTVTQEAAPAYLDVSPATLPVSYPEGSTGTFNITSNIGWTASASASWITLSKSNGSGDAAITVTAQKNPTTTSRTATITVSGTGVANKTVTVTQEASPASLEVSSATLSVAYQEGSTGIFNITSNIGWTASGSASWITLSNTNGSGDATITVTAQKNPSAASRSATITVSGTGVTNKTVTVTQEASPASLEVSSATLSVGCIEGSVCSFNITSNIGWTASGSASWITLSKSNGSGDATITVTAQKNPATASRTATITVSGTGVANKTVTVTQEASPASLEVSSANLSVAYQEGATGTFSITSNIGWTASGSATWFTLSSTGGSGDATIIVTAQKNPTTSVRTATVTLSGSGVANKTVTINQDGAPTGFDETSDSHIKIYPNPANSVLVFEGIPLNTTIFIYDINGRLCATGILREHRIDISALLSGVYTIVFLDDNSRYTHRFVKK